MDPELWKRVEHLLHAALERPAAKREAFLRQSCGDDEALYAEVRSLLDLDERAGGFLRIRRFTSPPRVWLDSPQMTMC